MFDHEDIANRLTDALEALERIPQRFATIKQPGDFLNDDQGREHLDSICMVLLATGEALRQIDNKTKGQVLSLYPQIPWHDIIGVRNVLAHGYFDIDAEQIFDICRNDIPNLSSAIRKLIYDIQTGKV